MPDQQVQVRSIVARQRREDRVRLQDALQKLYAKPSSLPVRA
ncbi:hypothetical protein ACIGW0_23575 [Streptomyces bikiniensis]|uniref:Transposase n=1 Tax=Streptomyces bikiniensis TaxID=1896 RepID=A0ABW8CXM9_STRBI